MHKQMPEPGFNIASTPRTLQFLPVLAIYCALLISCDAGTTNTPATANPDTPRESVREFSQATTTNLRQLTDAYLQQIDADLMEVSNSLALFQSSVAEFLANPDARSMDAAREAWLSSHIAYEITALHRYFISRILPDAQSLEFYQLQYKINQWPILPGYLDYVGDYPDSGIVNDPTVLLTEQNLRDQHGLFEVTEATLGFHVIEFLLWGINEDKTSPRPASDYLEATTLTSEQSASGITLDQIPTNRRRQILTLTTQALQADIQALNEMWKLNNPAARNRLQESSGPELLTELTSSMTDMLTEELLVRSLYLLLNGEYADSKQSPYSHASQNAVSAQLSGLETLLQEIRTSGDVTLDAVISSLSIDFAEFFYRNFDASKECLVLLYSNLQAPADLSAISRAEFEVVECINLVTNMVDHLGQISAMSY